MLIQARRSPPHGFTCVAALALVSACAGPEPPNGADLVEDPTDGIQLLVSIDRFTYAPGDPLEVRIQLVNRTGVARALSFPTSQRYELIIRDEAGADVYRWSDDTMFLQVLGEELLAPQEEGPVWAETVEAPAVPGEYSFETLVVASEGGLTAALPFEVRTDPGGGAP